MNPSRVGAVHQLSLVLLVIAGCQTQTGTPYITDGTFAEICEGQPGDENAKLQLSDASDEWFQVYEVSEGVYSIVEPYQFQETISHLILGEDRALLFDTGLGLLPIRPVVERITSLPVSVLNSHTHYDHVGGNAEFSSVLAINSEYTKANMSGFEHSSIEEDLAPDAFCNGPPEGVDVATFYVKPWKASRYIEDGEVLDLGGRTLEILQVPGHTPDAIALLDAENGLLFTGDTFYDAELWFFAPGTNLDDYGRSISRLAKLESNVKYLLGAHRSARVDAGRLSEVDAAFKKLRSGRYTGDSETGGLLIFVIDGVEFVTTQSVLDGKQRDTSKGSSGLDTGP